MASNYTSIFLSQQTKTVLFYHGFYYCGEWVPRVIQKPKTHFWYGFSYRIPWNRECQLVSLKHMQAFLDTVFPHIVSALEQFPPLNSFRRFMYCHQRSQYIRPKSKKNSFRGNYTRKYITLKRLAAKRNQNPELNQSAFHGQEQKRKQLLTKGKKQKTLTMVKMWSYLVGDVLPIKPEESSKSQLGTKLP